MTLELFPEYFNTEPVEPSSTWEPKLHQLYYESSCEEEQEPKGKFEIQDEDLIVDDGHSQTYSIDWSELMGVRLVC